MAKGTSITAIVCVLFLLAAGCSSPREKAADKEIALMNEIADKVATIKSNTDLVDAKPELEKLGARMKDLQNDEKNLPAATSDEEKKLNADYKDKKDKAATRLADEIKRLAKDVGPSAPFEVLSAMKLAPTGF